MTLMEGEVSMNDDLARIKRRLEFVVGLIQYLVYGRIHYRYYADQLDAIKVQLYNLFKEIDWYCNDNYPEGGRLISSKSKEAIVKKALARYLPCMQKSGRRSNVCDGCKVRFRCHVNGNVDKVTDAIKEMARRERKVFYRSELYEGVISETEFEARKKELGDCLGEWLEEAIQEKIKREQKGLGS